MPRPEVSRRARAAALLAATCVAAAPALAQERSPKDVKRDLLAVIVLEGRPCDVVVEARKLGENDYLAVCRTGDRYRVRIEAGRVRVEKQ